MTASKHPYPKQVVEAVAKGLHGFLISTCAGCFGCTADSNAENDKHDRCQGSER